MKSAVFAEYERPPVPSGNVTVAFERSTVSPDSPTCKLVPDCGIILSTSGDYSFSLVNSVGCDSIANINFTLNITGTYDITSGTARVLIRVTDMLGQEIPFRKNMPLLYIYSDGTIEKRIVIE